MHRITEHHAGNVNVRAFVLDRALGEGGRMGSDANSPDRNPFLVVKAQG